MEQQAIGAVAETSEFQGVATIFCPAIDEIAGIHILERYYGELSVIQFIGSPAYSTKQVDDLILGGFFPIEIGDMNYRSDGARSAAEFVAKKLGFSEADWTAGEQKLFYLLAEENQNGALKNSNLSIVWMIQELYHMSGYEALDLIARAKDVVRAFVADLDRKASGAPRDRDDADLQTEFADLTEILSKCQYYPFTIGRYLRDLWRLGEPVDDLRAKVNFWLTAWNNFQERYGQAKDEWPTMPKIEFRLTGDKAGAAIETSNRFIPKVGARTVAVLVNKNPVTGHSVFMTNKLRLSALARELDRIEPGRWYYHQQAGNLINGGPSYPDVVPTGLLLEQLVEMVKRFPPK